MANPSPSFFIFLFALLTFLPHFNNAEDVTSVSDACKDAAASSPNVDYNYCVQSLQADPSSSSTGKLGLAKIATNLASQSAQDTKTKVKKLLIDAAYAQYETEIHTCKSLYSRLVDYLAVAAKGIESSRLADAHTYLSASLDAPGECDEAFSKKQAPAMLANENATAKQLVAIALALVKMSRV
ncbi:hypothetical protein LUZ63_015795 [Rhynchospora breviuscula]|uniref:Pectinesterase inhibitor domain-containing protein n=1 Tax=Rhynchospora breviuscula TaxID=2022672 RepID=A0A9Q0CDC2_9POAL|nr:hypothetical protein LUZ63_015795 [Rhynchospora breviuscula]